MNGSSAIVAHTIVEEPSEERKGAEGIKTSHTKESISVNYQIAQ